MRKLSLVLIALAVAAAVGYLVWTTRSPGAPRTAEVAGPAAATPGDRSESAGAATAGGLAAPAAATELGGETAAPRAERADATIKARLIGRVRLPAGTPADERIEVLAARNALGRSSLELPRVDGEPIWRTSVREDGTFELPVGADEGTVHVLAEGRYAATRTSLPVELPAAEPLELVLELGTWVRGKLSVGPELEAARAELSQAPLELEPSRRGGLDEQMRQAGSAQLFQPRATHSDDGRAFEFRAVLGTGEGSISIAPKLEPRSSFAFARSPAFALAPGRALDVELALSGGATLAGRVVDEHGAPVDGAKLEVRVDPRIFGLGGDLAREAQSDADGRFELAAVRAGKSKLQIERDGYLTELFDLELAEGERRDGASYTLTHGARVAGVVLWPDRTPVADAKVSVGFDTAALTGMNAFNAWRGNEGSARSDARGAFAVGGLGAGPFVVRATAPPPGRPWDGSDENLHWRTSLAGIAPGNEALELVLQAPEGVEGRVLDAAGDPIAKFEVVARAKVNSIVPGVGGAEMRRSFEDADGRFALTGLERGPWELFAFAEGFGDPEPTALELPRERGAEPLELRLARAAVVSGVVLSFDGRPAADASVGRAVVLADLQRRLRPSKEPDATRTDSEGRFTLQPVSAGSVSLVARASGAAASEPLELALAPAEQRDDVVLRLRRGGTLIGEVFGDDGKPKGGANVLVQDPTQSSGQRMPRTDSAGGFRVEHLEPGTWQVIYMPWMSDDGALPSAGDTASILGSMKMTTATIREGEETHVTLGAPPKNPVLVRGRVRSHGEPVTGVVVNFMADGAKGLQSLKFVSVGADGAYETRLDGPGRYLVTVQSFGGAGEQQAYEFAHRVPAEPEHVLDIDLPGARISGRVLDSQGRPAPKTRVSLTARGAVPNGTILGGRYSEISTDDEGRYTMRWMEPGEYTLAAGGAPFGGMFGADHPLGREIKEITVADDADLRDVDFRLAASGSVSGVVRGTDGRPLGGAAIFVRDEQDRPLERLSLSQTGADGRFTYHGLAEGRYSLSARTKDAASATPVAVAVKGGETMEVELVVDPGTMLVVKLVDSKEEEVEATVLVTDEKGRQVNGMLTMAELMEVFQNGGFSSTEQRIGPLAPGLYKVTATAGDGRSASKSVSLGGQAERKLTLRLRD